MKDAKFTNDREVYETLACGKGWVAVAFVRRDIIACQHFLPEFEAYARLVRHSVYCVFIDVEENPTITEECLVEAMPTTLVFHKGDEHARFEGPYSFEALKDRIEKMMKSKH